MAMLYEGQRKRTQYPALYFPEASHPEGKKCHNTVELLEPSYAHNNRDPELSQQRI